MSGRRVTAKCIRPGYISINMEWMKGTCNDTFTHNQNLCCLIRDLLLSPLYKLLISCCVCISS